MVIGGNFRSIKGRETRFEKGSSRYQEKEPHKKAEVKKEMEKQREELVKRKQEVRERNIKEAEEIKKKIKRDKRAEKAYNFVSNAGILGGAGGFFLFKVFSKVNRFWINTALYKSFKKEFDPNNLSGAKTEEDYRKAEQKK